MSNESLPIISDGQACCGTCGYLACEHPRDNTAVECVTKWRATGQVDVDGMRPREAQVFCWLGRAEFPGPAVFESAGQVLECLKCPNDCAAWTPYRRGRTPAQHEQAEQQGEQAMQMAIGRAVVERLEQIHFRPAVKGSLTMGGAGDAFDPSDVPGRSEAATWPAAEPETPFPPALEGEIE